MFEAAIAVGIVSENESTRWITMQSGHKDQRKLQVKFLHLKADREIVKVTPPRKAPAIQIFF